MATNKELQARLDKLEAMLAAQFGRSAPSPLVSGKDRLDYIEFGSDRHAEFLGLTKDEGNPDNPAGWRLTDPTRWGMMARPEMLEEVLGQLIRELKSGPPPTPQSLDRRAPNYAPTMWRPDPVEVSFP